MVAKNGSGYHGINKKRIPEILQEKMEHSFNKVTTIGFYSKIRHPSKLACFLIQLPPKYDYNPENLESFFELLDPLFRYAVEFRNLSWMRGETWSLLEKYKVAYVIVDEPLLPPEVHLTADFAYFRWHGRGERPWFDYLYSKEELEPWIPKVEEAAGKVKKVVGYFNNHYHGFAPENCLYLIEKLGLFSEEQKRAKAKTASKQSQLGSYF